MKHPIFGRLGFLFSVLLMVLVFQHHASIVVGFSTKGTTTKTKTKTTTRTGGSINKIRNIVKSNDLITSTNLTPFTSTTFSFPPTTPFFETDVAVRTGRSTRKTIVSPLFQSQSVAETSTSSPFRKILRNVALVSLPFLLLWSINRFVSPDTVLGGAVASLKTVVKKANKRAIIGSIIYWWLYMSLLEYIDTKIRQSELATSEWTRYAKHPAARGRAIAWLAMQQCFYITAAKLSPIRRKQIRQKAGKNFANGLLKLGPLYIKLGQILSCRKNLLGDEWVEAMSILQDNVPAQTGDEALELAYSAFEGGKEEFDAIFEDFDTTPLAAASLGQVHKAKLKETGEEVAIKVQRPTLKTIYDQDFDLLTSIARFMDKLPKRGSNVQTSWTTIFNDAEEILYREIDYRDEADNAVRFANDFGLALGGTSATSSIKAKNGEPLSSAADWIRTPYVYKDLSNERALVMEYVPSIKITDTEKLDAAGVTATDKVDLADALARAYLRQLSCNLFFSADPHPGNLGVEIVSETNKPRLVMYDFGQAATLTQGQADGILTIIEAIIDSDVDRSMEAFEQMGVLDPDADLDKVRAKIAENFRTGKVKANLKTLKRNGYLSEATTVTTDASTTTSDSGGEEEVVKDNEVMSFFKLPTEYAFVARALSQMDGVGKTLDPDFDFISSAAPNIVEVKGMSNYLQDELAKFFQESQSKINDFQTSFLPKAAEEAGEEINQLYDKTKEDIEELQDSIANEIEEKTEEISNLVDDYQNKIGDIQDSVDAIATDQQKKIAEVQEKEKAAAAAAAAAAAEAKKEAEAKKKAEEAAAKKEAEAKKKAAEAKAKQEAEAKKKAEEAAAKKEAEAKKKAAEAKAKQEAAAKKKAEEAEAKKKAAKEEAAKKAAEAEAKEKQEAEAKAKKEAEAKKKAAEDEAAKKAAEAEKAVEEKAKKDAEKAAAEAKAQEEAAAASATSAGTTTSAGASTSTGNAGATSSFWDDFAKFYEETQNKITDFQLNVIPDAIERQKKEFEANKPDWL